MRLVSAFLFVALTGSAALADEAKPADPKHEVTKRKVPYRVVKLLPETRQVLLLDRIHGTHVVAEVGQSLDGYYVDDIDEEEVTLLGDNGAQIILTAPPPPRASRRPAPTAPAPTDAYGEAGAGDAKSSAASGPAPIDPYAEPEAPAEPGEGGVRVASAAGSSPAASGTPSPSSTAGSSPAASGTTASPSAAGSRTDSPPPPTLDDAGVSDPYGGDPGIAAFADAVGATPAPAPTTAAKPAASAKPAAEQPTSADDAAAALAAAATGTPAAPAASTSTATTPSAATATGAAPAPSATGTAGGSAATTATIARAELDAALANFGGLAASFRATFTPDGVRFDTIRDGTLLTKIGLRKGDVVTYVDGQPLRSLDDAASLYARAGTVRNTTLQVVRDGKLVTLRVAIQ